MIFENKDLFEHFEDGINKAIIAIRPGEFIITKVSGQAFLDGLRTAGAASNGLAHTQQNPAWLAVRDQIETMAKLFKSLIIARQQIPRHKLAQLLTTILAKAKIMVAAKSVSRQDVLGMIDKRKKFHVVQ